MKQTMQEMLDDLLAGGNDDDIELWIVINTVSASLGIDEKKMTKAEAEKLWATMSELITLMLQNGFIAVDLTKDGKYTAWPEQDPKQVLIQIRNKWVELKGKSPDVGFIVWFHRLNKP